MRNLLILIFCLITSVIYGQNHALTIQITGFKNNRGQVILDVFKTKDGFPMETSKATLNIIIPSIVNNEAEFILSALPEGEYAFAIIHDENSNKKLDQNFLGIPKEGAAASNNASGFMSPPSYEKAKFILKQNSVTKIKMLYF